MRNYFNILFLLLFTNVAYTQVCDSSGRITEFVGHRISGGVDFTIIGNSQNPFENNDISDATCSSFSPVLTTTSQLVLPNNNPILKAVLVWSGTGRLDNSVTLNGETITAERCFSQIRESVDYFSASTDVTELVQASGAGTYTFSGLDNSAIYEQFRCSNAQRRSTVYGGWALVVMYDTIDADDDYTIYFYDGLRLFRQETIEVIAQANVYEKYEGSHVGLISWEGDKDPRIIGDDITLNNQRISNGLDVANNIFNGTNTFADPPLTDFYNGDIDDFDASDVVQSQLNTEGAQFRFQLTTGNDLILLNNIVFRIPNEAPDAVIELLEDYNLGCTTNKTFTVNYEYTNLENASNVLVANTPISFYLNEVGGELLATTATTQRLAPGESATGSINLTLPADYIGEFEIIAYIDDPIDSGNEYGFVLELLEDNNTYTAQGFIDQPYYGLEIEEGICEGEVYVLDGRDITTPGTYPFNLRTQLGGCDSTGVVNLIVQPVFNDPPIFSEICEGDSFVLPDGEEVSPVPSHMPYTYVTNLLSRFNCDSIVTNVLTVNSIKYNTIQPQICLGENYVLPNGDTVSQEGKYVETLVGASADGCDSIVTVQLGVIDIEYPNAFAPNDNGKNEGFKALISDDCPLELENYKLQIFDKWGQLLFTTTDVREAWNGENAENNKLTNYYLWNASYQLPDGTSINRSGGVTLVR